MVLLSRDRTICIGLLTTCRAADRPAQLEMVESECGAVAVGRTYLLPPPSSGGASLGRPWLRFHTHRVTGGSHPPPVPTERGVRISRTIALRQLLRSTASALALVLAAHQQCRVAAWVKADLGEFLTGPCRLFDRVGDADAARLAARVDLVAARWEACPIGLRQCFLLVCGKVAAIVIEVQCGLVQHRRGRDQIFGSQFDRVETQFARGVVDQALDDIGCLGPSGAARSSVGVPSTTRSVRALQHGRGPAQEALQ